MKKIYLIRHAQSESNAGQAVRPNHAINLTDVGKTQAQALAEWLTDHISEPVTEIFVSQYLRTQQTAQPYIQRTNRLAIVNDEWHEFSFL